MAAAKFGDKRRTRSQRSQAAKKGWETRRKREVERIERARERSERAKRGWETRAAKQRFEHKAREKKLRGLAKEKAWKTFLKKSQAARKGQRMRKLRLSRRELDKRQKLTWQQLRSMITADPSKDDRFDTFFQYALGLGLTEKEAKDLWFSPAGA